MTMSEAKAELVRQAECAVEAAFLGRGELFVLSGTSFDGAVLSVPDYRHGMLHTFDGEYHYRTSATVDVVTKR